MGEDEKHPKGWILCAEYELYSCLSIECLGYNENGKFAAEHQLQPLIEEAEKYARDKGLRIFRYIISSIDISCHGRELNEYWKELRDLKSSTGRILIILSSADSNLPDLCQTATEEIFME